MSTLPIFFNNTQLTGLNTVSIQETRNLVKRKTPFYTQASPCLVNVLYTLNLEFELGLNDGIKGLLLTVLKQQSGNAFYTLNLHPTPFTLVIQNAETGVYTQYSNCIISDINLGHTARQLPLLGFTLLSTTRTVNVSPPTGTTPLDSTVSKPVIMTGSVGDVNASAFSFKSNAKPMGLRTANFSNYMIPGWEGSLSLSQYLMNRPNSVDYTFTSGAKSLRIQSDLYLESVEETPQSLTLALNNFTYTIRNTKFTFINF